MASTLRHFLQTGELGPLHFGMNKEEVIAVLGNPQDVSVARHPQILKYGALQLTFVRSAEQTDPVLAHIGLYYSHPAEKLPDLVQPGDFAGSAATTLADVRQFLDGVNLGTTFKVEGDQTAYLIMPSGARITFQEDKLWSINFAKPARTLARKRISFSVPPETWGQLSELAVQSGRSVSDLVREWTTRHASESVAGHARR